MKTPPLPNTPSLAGRAIDPAKNRSSRRIVVAAAAFVFLFTLLVLADWTFGNGSIRSIHADWVTMKSNTAAALMLCSMALALSISGNTFIPRFSRTVARVLALVVVMFSALTLAEYFSGFDLHIDRVLPYDPNDPMRLSYPGRFSPATGMCLIILGLALLAANHPRPNRFRLPLLKALRLTLVLISGIAIIGYAAHSGARANWWFSTGMAAQTSLCFFVSGVSLVALAWAEEGFEWKIDLPTTCGFLAGIALMLLATQFSYVHTVQIRRTAALIAHRQEVLAEIGKLSAQTALLERSRRAAFVAWKESAVEEHRREEDSALAAVEKLRQLTADNPRQTLRINELKALFEEDRRIEDQISNAPSANAKNPAAEEDHLGQRSRLIFQKMEEEERALLIDDMRISEAEATTVFLFLPITAFLSVTILLAGLVFLNAGFGERERAEESARANLERLQLATKAAQAGIWELDLLNGRVIWDDQMFRVFGLPLGPTKPGADQWFQFMSREDVARCTEILEEAIAEGRDSFELEFQITRADDGSERAISSAGIIKRDGDGRAVMMIGTNRDVTAERQREKDLAEALSHEKDLSDKARAAESAKGEFLAVMSHELRNPMNGIMGFAEQLALSPSLPEDCRGYSQTILKSSEALLRILDDILDFSRLDAGRMTFEKICFSPMQLVGDIRSLMARQAGDKNLVFETVIAGQIPEYLEGDAGRIRQILLNLLGNAIKFTGHGSVSLILGPGAPREDGTPVFEFLVRDTGEGIDPDKLQAIFEPFTQADSSISRRHGGTGLGLSISLRLATLMGGTITARSLPGHGSEFCLALPLGICTEIPAVHMDAPGMPLDAGFARRCPLDILIVEDDSVNLHLLDSLMRKMGYQPLAAKNGREAVEVFREKRPDCVFMDLQMPEMGGIEATEKIRGWEAASGNGRPAFISALTANIFPADRKRCMDAGMNAYLNKPEKSQPSSRRSPTRENSSGRNPWPDPRSARIQILPANSANEREYIEGDRKM